ncbi:hypothetical protein C4J81_01795 [Deltaproteobacteria bacterium Smac51]|nr:hypothetical protein C4J81_01795 [Deltaproteobacteria bacterium Smac51]
MSNQDVSLFFITALQAEQQRYGRGFQVFLAQKAGIHKATINGILNGHSRGSDHIRRAIAEALGYSDYEDFLDIGRRVTGVAPVRGKAENNKPPQPTVPDMLEILLENRELHRRLDRQQQEYIDLQHQRINLLHKREVSEENPCDPSVREMRSAPNAGVKKQ